MPETMDAAAIKALLDNPVVNISKLSSEFNSEEEADYLYTFINSCPDLQECELIRFISAGGSCMVFEVKWGKQDLLSKSLRVGRKKKQQDPKVSPFSKVELEAMKELVHPNILRQYDFVENSEKVTVAICAALINNPQGFDEYIQSFLEQETDTKSLNSRISPERLNYTCKKIIAWFYQIAQAIQYMHKQGYYHMDIKPANILVHSQETLVIPILTDMGSCVKRSEVPEEKERVRFTYAYAHPELRDMKSDLQSITGGLAASAKKPPNDLLPVYDLYALGRTILQILAIIESYFGRMSYSDYLFRYMHIIAALLLDGKNINIGTEIRKGVAKEHGITFLSNYPMEIDKSIFSSKKIKTADELVERLKRYKTEYSIYGLADEFRLRKSKMINNTIGDLVPFTHRIARVFNHPTIKRLYNEPQLGLMTEIYPGASHNRWSHTLGVYSFVLKYYASLLSDQENPLLKILINREDINHAIIAAIFHDLGQTSLCHDMEAVNSNLFDHTSYINDLINEEGFNRISLKKLLEEDGKYWGKIDFDRVLSILKGKSKDPVDFIATDSIDGPIDADKSDYLVRDSYYCGTSYGAGIDHHRFLNSLTVSGERKKLRLAYYSKGRTAISSLLTVRCQLYGTIYWHHTFRCIHSMLYYATIIAFGQGDSVKKLVTEDGKGKPIGLQELRKLYYNRVICKKSWEQSWRSINQGFDALKPELKEDTPFFQTDVSLDFIYRFTDGNGKELLENIYKRKLFKRVYSRSMKGIARVELMKCCDNREQISTNIQKELFEKTKSVRNEGRKTDTSVETMVSGEFEKFEQDIDKKLFVLVDFPLKNYIPDKNWLNEISDSSRKFLNFGRDSSKEILKSSNDLLREISRFRVYLEPSFYNIIIRYLHPEDIEDCIRDLIKI